MDKANNLTVVILTKNEEKNIVDVVKNAKQVAEDVLIVDSGSTDNTVALAEANGAMIAYRAWDNDFAAQRNFALQYVKTEWVLYLDADERLNSRLIEAIKRAVTANKQKQYSIKRKSVAFGQEFNYGVLKPDFVPRLFKTKNVQWVNKVHERSECQDKLELIDGYIEHYTYQDWEQWLNKFNQYTSIWANDKYIIGKRVTLIEGLSHSVFGFLQMLIIKKGILDGKLGFVLCIMHFFYTFTKYLKLINLQKNSIN